MAFFTFGEGYHNYHHTFATDYRNGVRWYQFDPSKWLIFTLETLGIAKNVKRVNKYVWQRRLLLEQKENAMNTLKKTRKEQITEQVEKLYARLNENLVRMSNIWTELRKRQGNKKQLKEELRTLHRMVKQQWKQWNAIQVEAAI